MESIQAVEKMIAAGRLEDAMCMLESPLFLGVRWQIENLKGIIYAYRGQHQQAEACFQAALEQRPDEPDILFNMADICISLGKWDEAVSFLLRCAGEPGAEQMEEELVSMWERTGRQRRILIVAYDFPPLSRSEWACQSRRLVEQIPRFGWCPTVIAADQVPNGWDDGKSKADACAHSAPSGAEIIRIPDHISTGRETQIDGARAYAVMCFLHKILRYSPAADKILSQKEKNVEGLSQMLLFPCSALCWAYDLTVYLEKNMDPTQFQAVYTVSLPASAHLVGYYLSQTYGIPWIACYESPLSGGDADKLLSELGSLLFQRASFNLSVSQTKLSGAPRWERLDETAPGKQLVGLLEKAQPGGGPAIEIPAAPYDYIYQSGGLGSIYRSHYTKSHYYGAWLRAMEYISTYDRSIRILEIGCGPGQFANMLFDYGYTNYTGFDYSTEAVSLAKKNNPAYSRFFQTADAFQTTLLDKAYELVICFEVLEHLQEDLTLLRRIRAGTKVLLSVPNFDDPYHIRYFRTNEEVRNRYQSEILISDISSVELNPGYSLYYIAGEKR